LVAQQPGAMDGTMLRNWLRQYAVQPARAS
jgi:hypothetical protein